MNEEIDETEFYHQDFTTATEWEIFIARMEEIINQWKTDEPNNDEVEDSVSIWNIRSEKINFADFDFNFVFYRKKNHEEQSDDGEDKQIKNPIDSLYDFEMYNERNATPESCLGTWYGLNKFMALTPARNIGINSESKIKILLSSVYIVSSNLKCEVPIFVQIREKWQRCFLGVYENEGVRTNFEMIHLRRGPQHCQYLTGLLDLFKTKIMSPRSLNTVMVSVQATYTLTDFGNFIWKQDENMEPTVLPFGVGVDPIQSIILKTTWSQIPENFIVDSESYSDFDPMQAQTWSCIVNMTNDPMCLLNDCMSEFLQILNNNFNVYDFLGEYAVSPDIVNPLDVLTEPAVPTISTLLNRAASSTINKSRKGTPPISENVLVPLLYFLFPDADKSSTYPYLTKENDKDSSENQSPTKKASINLEQECKGYKTCPNDSLIWRLSIVLTHSLQYLGGAKALAHMWYEFVQEMRYRWEKSMLIPGLTPGFPDLRTCLLNQKLQMLNCCIERKMNRENSQNLTAFEDAEDSSADEEFFECSEKPEDDPSKKYSLWNQPVGRLSKFGDLKLLKSGDPLYIPITQDPVLKTEDQLEEDTEVLLKLGSDIEASELRARIMSASLLSDMESFKAANPGSIVEDFIRWYSPRDWIEEEELDEWGQRKGHLSPRMLIEENNIWVQIWESAKPVPANRQKRLFDDTREAEKILQFLEQRTLAQIGELILPVLAHAAIYRLVDEYESVSVDSLEITSRLGGLVRQGERISRDSKFQARRFELFLQEMSGIELIFSQVHSLEYKFAPSGIVDSNLSDSIGNLVIGKEIEIENRTDCDITSRILSMFSEALKNANMTSGDIADNRTPSNNSVFPTPSEREFVMRVSAPKPANYSSKCPQFLRAILSKNEFRLAGAFSEDIVFF